MESIQITKTHYETIWEFAETLKKDRERLEKLNADLIDKVTALNEIIFDRTNDIIHLEKENKQLKDYVENIYMAEIKSLQLENEYLYGDLEEIKTNTICQETKNYIDRILSNRKRRVNKC